MQVKGLLPDEEKEKIGPKNVSAGRASGGKISSAAIISAKPQTNPGGGGGVPGQHKGGMPVGAVTLGPHPGMPPSAAALAGLMMGHMRPPPLVMQAPGPPPPGPLGFMPGPPPPQQHQHQQQMVVQPPPQHLHQHQMKHAADEDLASDSKKPRLGGVGGGGVEDSLVPEEVWAARHPAPVPLKVAVPALPDKAEWRLNGQLLGYSLAPRDTVAQLKARLQDDTGMQPAKQKLHLDGLFLKDSNTLAFYNILPNTVLQLQVKERGGRKK